MNKLQATMLAAAMAIPALGWSQGVLYATGHTVEDQKITLTAWGSGTIKETDETGYDGALSVRVSFRNYFQGGVMGFGAPVDLSQAYGDKYSLLRFVIRVADSKMTLGGPGNGKGKGGGAAVGGGGGKGEGGAIGAGPPQQGGGAKGGGLPGGSNSGTVQPLHNVRLIIATTDGKMSEAYVPVNLKSASANGWISSAIPLTAIRGFDSTNKTVKSVALSGDTTTTVYLGDLRIVSDTTPITGDVSRDSMNLALGDEVVLQASGYGGSSVLKYSWNFDSAHGDQEDAVGQAVRHRFRKAGDFVVKVTISDTYGLKQPISKTINVKVNP